MTIAIDQDFITTAGDDVYPIFTVRDGAGVPIDISTVSDITWYYQVTGDGPVLLLLKKSTGGIEFVTTGVDGMFQVNIGKALTASLDGWYQHAAAIIDALGNITTVAVGRMKVGLRPSWTYDAAKIADYPLFQVRRLVGDVIQNDQQLQDGEINFALELGADNIYLAGAEAARMIAAQYSRKVDTVSPGELRTAYGAQAGKYALLAKQLDAIALKRGTGVVLYAGGISVEDKITNQQNLDRVSPSFNIGMQDARLPVSQTGNETPTMPHGVGGGGA